MLAQKSLALDFIILVFQSGFCIHYKVGGGRPIAFILRQALIILLNNSAKKILRQNTNNGHESHNGF